MAYSELIKNFNGIRSYLRSFYVFGFMHRDEFTRRAAAVTIMNGAESKAGSAATFPLVRIAADAGFL